MFFNSKEIISLSIDSTNLTLSLFNRTGENKFTLNGYQRYNLADLEIHNFNIFNQIKLNKILQNFFNHHKLKRPNIYLSLSNPEIKEKFLVLENVPKQIEDFNLDVTSKFNWNFYQLDSEKKYTFYLLGIPHSLIFQYNLFSINNHINFLKITSHTASLINIAKDLMGLKISDIEDIKKQINKSSELININDFLDTDLNINLIDEKKYLLNNLGLYLMAQK